MKLEVLRQVFEKRSNTKFYQNPYSGIRTDMTKLIVTFRNFVNAPKKLQYIVYMKYGISHLTMKTVLKLHKKANRLEVQLYCLSHSVLLKQFLCWTALNVQYPCLSVRVASTGLTAQITADIRIITFRLHDL